MILHDLQWQQSVATKVLIALLLLARVHPARAAPSSESYTFRTLGSISVVVCFICLVIWACFLFTSLRQSWMRSDQVAVHSALAIRPKLVLAVSCLCNPCLASKVKPARETSSDYDIWYLLGCAVNSAWEGLETFMLKSPSTPPAMPKADVSIQTRKR